MITTYNIVKDTNCTDSKCNQYNTLIGHIINWAGHTNLKLNEAFEKAQKLNDSNQICKCTYRVKEA